jgi:hypothetical protein
MVPVNKMMGRMNRKAIESRHMVFETALVARAMFSYVKA